MSSNPSLPLTSQASLPHNWAILCIFNLLITALLGLLMRYKIVYAFPFLDQAFTLHAHQNFVFMGWVGLTLFSCIINFALPPEKAQNPFYKWNFYFYWLMCFGMLFSYLLQGYTVISISFTGLTFISAFLFIYRIWLDLSHAHTPKQIRLFLKGAMVWFLLSLPGVFMLVYFNQIARPDPFLIRSSLYYFLHFQYNGWFTFTIFALLLNWLYRIGRPIRGKIIGTIFWLLSIGLIPGYFLSILAFYPKIWAEIPSVISVFTYLVAAVILFRIILRLLPYIRTKISGLPRVLWIIATFSFFIKTLMQALTLVPSLAAFAFSFRPLVIGFLHLTFLCFVSFFLIGYLIYHDKLQARAKSMAHIGLSLFILFVILMELALFTHSFFVFLGIYPPYMTAITLWVTGGLFIGILLFVLGQFRKPDKQEEG